MNQPDPMNITGTGQTDSASYPGSSSIGYIVGGSLKENLRVRLTLPAEEVQQGAFVVVESGRWLYYGLVTDLQLGSTDPRFADEQSEARLPQELAGLLHGQTLYTNLEVMPVLMLDRGPEPGTQEYADWLANRSQEDSIHAQPVKSVPAHHAVVRLANRGDVAEIFGSPTEKHNFVIGYTPEQNLPVCINLDKFVQRSSGIFGATGTGKSFLTRIILAGLMHYNKSSVLVFDMHNEYGYQVDATDTRQSLPGLRDKFPAGVTVVGLGRATTINGRVPDFHLEISESDIQPEDIELLTRELNLKETTPTTLDALVTSLGRDEWFARFGEMVVGKQVRDDETGKLVPAPDSVAFWANDAGTNPMAAEGLRNKMNRVFNRPYIVANPASDTLKVIIDSLKKGRHVVLSFGEYSSDLDYLLVTNMITRRIREEWVKTTEKYRSDHKEEPRPLVIVVEEAHKLLNREMASQTTFSTIAREMRKYYVTLLIVDQRPSQIYDEVMSQLGTRVSGKLGDEDDIHAVLSGLAGRDSLRGMLANLKDKEEVIVLGWTVPMPIPIRSRRYDLKFWEELLGPGGGSFSVEKAIRDLGFT